MANDNQTQTTTLVLDAGNISKGLEKLEKDITKIGVQTEKALATLNSESNIYKTLEKNHLRLAEIQSRIIKLKKDDTLTSAQISNELQTSLGKYSIIKQQVTDINKLLNVTPSQLRSQGNEITKIEDKFSSLNREVRSLQGHYKTLGSSKDLKNLSSQMEGIKHQQEIISNLSKKGIINLTTSDLKTLDTAKARYRELKNQVADTKAELSDVSIGGLAKSAGVRALGYSALFAIIAGITQAVGVGTKYILEYESGIKRLQTILDISASSASNLEGKLADLGRTYGEQLDSINKVALELSRAGLALNQVADASEVVIKLALLTGDSIEQSASSIISFTQVFGRNEFGQVIASVDELGAKLAYLANKSRLGTQDINTFANYALASAKAIGLTIDAVNGLASALSNASFNASTIGTQIRKFTIALGKDTGAISNFFQKIGVNQQNLAKQIAQGGEESNKALLGFLDTIKSYSRESYNEALSGVEVLTKNVFQALQNNANEIQTNLRESLNVTSDEIDKAKNITEDYRKTWSKFANNILSDYNNVFKPVFEGLIGYISTLNNRMALSDFFGFWSSISSSFSEGADLIDIKLKLVDDSLKNFGKNGSEQTLKRTKYELTQIQQVLEAMIAQATKKNESFDVIQRLEQQLNSVKKQQKELTKSTQEYQNILNDLSSKGLEQQNQKNITSLTRVIGLQEAQLKTLDSTSKQYTLLETQIEKNRTRLEQLKKPIEDITEDTKVFKETFDFFSTADLTNIQNSMTSFNKAINIASTEELPKLQNILETKIQRTLQELPKTVNTVKARLSTLGEDISFLNVDSFKGAGSAIIEIESRIDSLRQNSLNANKEEVRINEEKINVYNTQKALLQNLVDANNLFLNSSKRISDLKEQQEKQTKKEKRRQDNITKQIIRQQVSEAQLALQYKDKDSLLLAEINTRGKLLGNLQDEKNIQNQIAKIKALSLQYDKASFSTSLIDKEREITDEIEAQEVAIKDRIPLETTLLQIKNEQKFQNGEITKAEYLQNQQRIKDLRDLNLQSDKLKETLDSFDKYGNSGFAKALQSYKDSIPTITEALEQVGNVGLQSLENGFMNFFDVTNKGFMDMGDLAKSVIQEIYKELIRTLIVKQAVSGIGSIVTSGIGSLFSSGASAVTSSVASTAVSTPLTDMYFGSLSLAKGGLIDGVPNGRVKGYASGGLLTGGSGTKDDLYLGQVNGTTIMAMGGEHITQKSSVNPQTRPMLDYINKTGSVPSSNAGGTVVNSPVSINIENKTGTDIDAKMIEQITKKNDNDEYEKIVTIMLQAKETDSRIRSAFGSNNGRV
jgi:TP901 family phage tail tape measure protein